MILDSQLLEEGQRVLEDQVGPVGLGGFGCVKRQDDVDGNGPIKLDLSLNLLIGATERPVHDMLHWKDPSRLEVPHELQRLRGR